ncbi:hypothetical protein T310_8082 [Rasamsonia emersonii CBS 393.64]|uniref:Uncharacterized protein n=1 Tax=Rasamsonia emersonii (strain ATCC 16479 / CBS 393.64 / IMI 116815) TaxID=1408163 RepID=A0A0F4YI52_RASE3|nr:hypothetical protein T310_8082 [Rasamsonia emersonii CBS 393.64]KKA17977.1 hypothetical protein T310_8082 [Rasamsonia emersonii CBS 393.64]
MSTASFNYYTSFSFKLAQAVGILGSAGASILIITIKNSRSKKINSKKINSKNNNKTNPNLLQLQQRVIYHTSSTNGSTSTTKEAKPSRTSSQDRLSHTLHYSILPVYSNLP